MVSWLWGSSVAGHMPKDTQSPGLALIITDQIMTSDDDTDDNDDDNDHDDKDDDENDLLFIFVNYLKPIHVDSYTLLHELKSVHLFGSWQLKYVCTRVHMVHQWKLFILKY